MKRFNLIPAVIAIVLMMTAVSCTTMTGAQDEYYDRSSNAPNRIYVDDPYRGTVVLERDPYTGRYYEVNSYGGRNQVYRSDNGYYGRNYDSRYRNNNRGGYPRVNNPRVYPSTQQPTEEQKREQKKNKDEARKKVLGG